MTNHLDITGEHCPMTYVKVKLFLSRMACGGVLDVLLCEGEPLANVPRAAQEQGHRIIEIRKEGAHFHVIIEKLV